MDLVGVNISGAEFGSIGGTYGYNYIYPSHSEIDYYASEGVNVIRMPFLWERLQPTLNGPLDAAELARMDDVVDYAATKGIMVDLDVHNYGYYNGQLVGSATVPNTAFANFWGRLSAHYASDSNLIFGLMNEPQQSSASGWLGSVNAAIDAIRASGATQEILVPGINWDGAWSWVGSSNATVIAPGIVDPLHNYAFEVHQYLDNDGSGTHSTVVSDEVGVQRVQAITQWAEQTGNKLFLGETGVANDPTSLEALNNMLTYMNLNSAAWQGVTYWAAGAWWGDYMYSIEPTDGVDAAQMAVLKQFENNSTSTSALFVASGEVVTLTGVSIYPGSTNVFGTLRLDAGGSIAASLYIAMNEGGVFDISADTGGAVIKSLAGLGGSVALGRQMLTITNTSIGVFDGVVVDGGASGGVGGALKIAGSASITLGGLNTYTGKTAVFGTLHLGAGSSIAASKNVKMNSGGVFDISADVGGATIKKLKGPGGVVELGGQTLTINTPSAGEFDGVITDGLGTGGHVVFAGTGAMLLSGSSSYTGGTSLGFGSTLELNAAEAAGSGAIAFSGAGQLLLDAPALTALEANRYTFTNPIAGMALRDSITLTGLEYEQGATATIDNGVLTVASGNKSVTMSLTHVADGTAFVVSAGGGGVGTQISQGAVTTGFVYSPAYNINALSALELTGLLAPSTATALGDAIAMPSNSASSTPIKPSSAAETVLTVPAHA